MDHWARRTDGCVRHGTAAPPARTKDEGDGGEQLLGGRTGRKGATSERGT